MEPIRAAFAHTVTDLGLIGRVDENNTRTVAFDCTDVMQTYPNGKIVCVYQRMCDIKPYALLLQRSGNVYTATLTAGDLCVPGRVRMELRVLEGQNVLKSAIYLARVAVSLRGEGDTPESPTADVLNRLSETLDDAIAATEDAKAIADRAEQAAKKAEEAADAAGSIVAGTLPVATSERLGGVKIGENLTITEDGTLSARGGVAFETDETLSLDNGVLSVNRAQDVEQDNTLPITSAAVYATVGNINALLGTI